MKTVAIAALSIGAAFAQRQCTDQIVITHAPFSSGTAIAEMYGEHGEYTLSVRAGTTEDLNADVTVSIRTADGARYTQPIRFTTRTKPVRLTFLIGDRQVEQVNVTQRADIGFPVGPEYTEPSPYGRCVR